MANSNKYSSLHRHISTEMNHTQTQNLCFIVTLGRGLTDCLTEDVVRGEGFSGLKVAKKLLKLPTENRCRLYGPF